MLENSFPTKHYVIDNFRAKDQYINDDDAIIIIIGQQYFPRRVAGSNYIIINI